MRAHACSCATTTVLGGTSVLRSHLNHPFTRDGTLNLLLLFVCDGRRPRRGSRSGGGGQGTFWGACAGLPESSAGRPEPHLAAPAIRGGPITNNMLLAPL